MNVQEEFIYDPDVNVIPSTPGKKINRDFIINLKI